jgi:hypothetical protein
VQQKLSYLEVLGQQTHFKHGTLASIPLVLNSPIFFIIIIIIITFHLEVRALAYEIITQS